MPTIQVSAQGIHEPFRRVHEPVTVGVPLARGTWPESGTPSLTDPAGRAIPVQTRPLDRWPDGSVRWLLVDFQADSDRESAGDRWTLAVDDGMAPAPPGPAVVLDAADDGLTVDTGAARFRFRPNGRFPFEEVRVGAVAAVDPRRTGFHIADDHLRRHVVVGTDVEVEVPGPLHAVVRIDGRAGESAADPFVEVTARLHFFAGSATVRFEVTLRNPRRALHKGNYWELGDEGSIYLRNASFVVAMPAADDSLEISCSPELGAPFTRCAAAVELHQDSSGGPNWNSSNHLNRHRVRPVSFRGYRWRVGDEEQAGLRATPVVSMTRGPLHLSVTMPHFWQSFPKSIAASGDTLTLGLFPSQYADLHELQGGEQKTHVFVVAFGRDGVSEVPLDWARVPLAAHATPEEYAGSGAVRYLLTADHDPNDDYKRLVSAAVDGDDTFAIKREAIDEYGWRNFGELYADHETVFHKGPPPLVSHYNNQYDAVAGCAYQFMRTGDVRWWRLSNELAAHVVDIDVYRTTRDRPLYSGGLFWHTFHYADAGIATHRAYPRAPGVGGGGPSPEHNYATGLMLHYFMTGDALSRETAVTLARWVIAMDDGTRAPYVRYLVRSETGWASATGSTLYNGPGRGGGNSINVLLDGYRLSGERRFLEKAETLIRRCIHPADDIDGRELLNAERRWSYTVFLHALGKYLDDKADLNEVDGMYAYARDSLLAYARWMAAHERPYLDRPEQLEYPTETWAAQELWKTDVFILAAKHAAGDERARFLERADFFFRYAMTTLVGMPTRTLTRPVVLLLSHGYMHGYAQRHGDQLRAPAPVEVPAFGSPQVFVPQKELAKKRAAALTLFAAVLLMVAAAYYVFL